MFIRRTALLAMALAFAVSASVGLTGHALATDNPPIIVIIPPPDIPDVPVDDHCALGDPSCAANQREVSCTCHVHADAAGAHTGLECHSHTARAARMTQNVCDNPNLLAGLTRRQIARLPH